VVSARNFFSWRVRSRRLVNESAYVFYERPAFGVVAKELPRAFDLCKQGISRSHVDTYKRLWRGGHG
jgi:hypothetical protein